MQYWGNFFPQIYWGKTYWGSLTLTAFDAPDIVRGVIGDQYIKGEVGQHFVKGAIGEQLIQGEVS